MFLKRDDNFTQLFSFALTASCHSLLVEEGKTHHGLNLLQLKEPHQLYLWVSYIW